MTLILYAFLNSHFFIYFIFVIAFEGKNTVMVLNFEIISQKIGTKYRTKYSRFESS